MATRRVTAEYIYTSSTVGVIRNGYVDYDDADGTIVGVGACTEGESVCPGALAPGFVNGLQTLQMETVAQSPGSLGQPGESHYYRLLCMCIIQN